MPKISIIIDESTGEITVDGEGFEGTACDAVMKAFEDALGKVKRRHDKPAYRREGRRTQENKR